MPHGCTQQEAFPYLYAMISAFWRGRIQFDEDSLCHAAAAGDAQAARQRMEEIRGRILSRPELPL